MLRGSESVSLGGTKRRALLAYLLLHRDELVRLDQLVGELWVKPPPTAEKVIRLYVAKLRALLAGEGAAPLLLTRPGGYELCLDGARLDVQEFEAAAKDAAAAPPDQAAELLRDALGLWRGTPLADLDDEPFVVPARERLEHLRVEAQLARLRAELGCGEHASLVPELEALSAEHPLDERLRAALMLALYRSGRQVEALEVFRRAREELVRNTGLEPGRDLRRLERAILEQDPTLDVDLPSKGPIIRIPAGPNRLIGRDRECERAYELLRDESVRLVTVTGPGGVGKTRLAVEVASRAAPLYQGGAYFIALDAISEPDLVLSAVCRGLEVHEGTFDALAEHVRASPTLLALDSFERVLPAAPLIAELLAAAPRLNVIVSSRSVLHLSAEHDFPVRPLDLPAGDERDPLVLRHVPAVELFVERAAAAKPSFDLRPDNAGAVAAICRRLEGLPLSIELAAAWVKLMPPREVLRRLESRFELLTSGPRDAPPRQRTLRAAIDWSYELLDERQQRLFERLAIFAGGWTIAAAQALCGDGGKDVLGSLAALLDKSLIVQRETAQGTRLAMLDTLREYARERLEQSSELDAVGRRHATFFAELAEAAEPQLHGPEQARLLDDLELEHDNFRAALAFCRQRGEPALMLRIASALGRFWYLHNHLREGYAWLEAALSEGGNASPPDRARALRGSALLASRQGRLHEATEMWEESLRLFRDLGADDEVARCLNNLGNMAVCRGDLDEARTLYDESRALASAAGERWVHASATNNLGDLALGAEDYAQARRLFEQSLTVHRELADSEGIAISLVNLGFVALACGDHEEARSRFSECIDISRELDHHETIVACLEGAGSAATAAGDADCGARLLGSAEARCEAIGFSLGPFEQKLHEQTVADVRARLSDAELDAAWAAGRALDLDEAVELAFSRAWTVAA